MDGSHRKDRGSFTTAFTERDLWTSNIQQHNLSHAHIKSSGCRDESMTCKAAFSPLNVTLNGTVYGHGRECGNLYENRGTIDEPNIDNVLFDWCRENAAPPTNMALKIF